MANTIVRRIGCTDKVQFPTWGHAAKAAKKMRRNGENVEEYRCNNCGKYHVGHPSTESVQRKRSGKMRRQRVDSLIAQGEAE